MIDDVDPFLGSSVTDLPQPTGIAATWWWPKPSIGNTHPGAIAPFGMVSSCLYSGAYPTGYGLHDKSTEGVPANLEPSLTTSGFTHFHQSGTGAIRKYYNYVRVTPMVDPLDDLGRSWGVADETASPGYYRCQLSNAIDAELTVGPKSATHRYTFPPTTDARIVVDMSHGGLAIPHGRTVPLRASVGISDRYSGFAEISVEGAPLAADFFLDQPDWSAMVWYDRRLMPGSSHLAFDHITPTTLRPFGLLWRGPLPQGGAVELEIGFSLRGVERARTNRKRERVGTGFGGRRDATAAAWRDHLGSIEIDAPPGPLRDKFATAWYRSLTKPSFASDESPFWPTDGPFVFDICTMWDIYRTQLPLITLLFPERANDLAVALTRICEEEGNYPIGYRMARGADRFARQGSSLAHTFMADLCSLDRPGVDWEWTLPHLHADLHRSYGEEVFERGVAHPVTHTLDIAQGCLSTALVARRVGDVHLATELERLSHRWVNAFDPDTGLLIDSTFYEGGRWNYSFRLVADMAARIELAGGDERFVALLDQFFGYGAEPVKQLGVHPDPADVTAGYELNRFQGLNNEPDLDAPWAYHWCGRPDRTAEVVHGVVHQMFATGPGGLPGNDDSGGLSSWFVWATIGLFPVAGQQRFLINAPSFRRTVLQVTGGQFVIESHSSDPMLTIGDPTRVAYVVAAELDGQQLDRSWLSLADVDRGGHLRLELAGKPDAWATADRPPTYTTAPEAQPSSEGIIHDH